MGFCRYFVEILQETSDMNEIQFHEDGTWSPLKTSKEHHVISCSPAAHKSSHKESRSSSSSASGTPSGYTVAFIMCVLKDHRFNFITKNQLLFASILFRVNFISQFTYLQRLNFCDKRLIYSYVVITTLCQKQREIFAMTRLSWTWQKFVAGE